MEITHKAQGIDNTKETKKLIEVSLSAGEEVIHIDDFSYDGYQVVRGEFFAHLKEPSISFNNQKISLNTACLKRFPEVEYVQMLVDSKKLKLAVRPTSEDIKDSFIWCSKGKIRRPKQITCRMFFAKIVDMMDWNPDYRYKLLGKLIYSGSDYLFVFDLTSPEIFQRVFKDGERPKNSRTPIFPKEWQNQFGLSVDEHHKRYQVDIFKGYTIFSIKDSNASEISFNQKEE